MIFFLLLCRSVHWLVTIYSAYDEWLTSFIMSCFLDAFEEYIKNSFVWIKCCIRIDLLIAYLFSRHSTNFFSLLSEKDLPLCVLVRVTFGIRQFHSSENWKVIWHIWNKNSCIWKTRTVISDEMVKRWAANISRAFYCIKTSWLINKGRESQRV